MTKFDTFGHISPCRLGRRGKKLFKPEYISGQGPTQKKIDQFADPCAGKLIFSHKTLACSIDWTPEQMQKCPNVPWVFTNTLQIIGIIEL